MKQLIIAVYFLIFFAQITTSAMSSTSKKIIITINNNNQSSLTNTSSVLNQTPPPIIQPPQSPPTDHASNVWQKLFEQSLLHKVTVLVGTLSTVYATVLCLLWYKNYAITKKNIWGSWHASVSLDDFKKIPSHDLAQQLYQAILTHYAHRPLQYDFLTPIIAFLSDVEIEQQRISKYTNFCSWLQTLGVSYILPNQHTKFFNAQTQYERLTFLKQTLLTWMRAEKAVA